MKYTPVSPCQGLNSYLFANREILLITIEITKLNSAKSSTFYQLQKSILQNRTPANLHIAKEQKNPDKMTSSHNFLLVSTPLLNEPFFHNLLEET